MEGPGDWRQTNAPARYDRRHTAWSPIGQPSLRLRCESRGYGSLKLATPIQPLFNALLGRSVTASRPVARGRICRTGGGDSWRRGPIAWRGHNCGGGGATGGAGVIPAPFLVGGAWPWKPGPESCYVTEKGLRPIQPLLRSRKPPVSFRKWRGNPDSCRCGCGEIEREQPPESVELEGMIRSRRSVLVDGNPCSSAECFLSLWR